MNGLRITATAMCAAIAIAGLGPQALADGATIKGKVNWEGKPYRGKRIQMGQDPTCAAVHGSEGPRNQKVVSNDNGTLRYVFVYVKNAPEGNYPVPSEPVLLDQVGCMYEPHVFAVRAGQDILIRNSDDTAHNIHAVPRKNAEFNRSQPKKDLEFTESFKRPEIMVPFKCDVHPWMSAYCAVMDHPFFDVTGEDGTFIISGLPPGTYTVVAWQERFGEKEMEVTVAQDETMEIEFGYSRDTEPDSD